MEPNNNKHTNGKETFVDDLHILEIWMNTGVKIFMDKFQSKKTKQINRDNTKSASSSVVADVAKSATAFGLGTTTGAVVGFPAGKAVQSVSKAIMGICYDKVATSISGMAEEKKRRNLLSWTNTLTKKLEKEFVISVAQGIALICISYKEQIKSFPDNDSNKISFFDDATQRIFKHLQENPSHGRQLTEEIVFQAFLFGRSVSKPLTINKRGLVIKSNDQKWNTKTIFEDAGLIVSDCEGSVELFVKKENGNVPVHKKDFRIVHTFEDPSSLQLAKNYRRVEKTDQVFESGIFNDWRLRASSIKSCIGKLRSVIQFPKDLEDKKPSELEKESHIMLKAIAESMASTSTSKYTTKPDKVLDSQWWPEEQNLVSSFYHRKNTKGYLIIHDLMEKLIDDGDRKVVITQKENVPGLGGVGKTSLAKWYAIQYKKSYTYIFWIECGEGSLLKSFKNLARDLKVEDRNEMDLATLARKCYDKVSEHRCLFIFDNAEGYQGSDGIKHVLPKNRHDIFCVITSRIQGVWGTGTGDKKITEFHLGVFDIAESREFLEENLIPEIIRNNYKFDRLSELLGNLPLALQLAVAALNNGKINLNDYIVRASPEDLGKIVDKNFDDYEKTINMNIGISLDMVKTEEEGNLAYEILKIFGYIRPENVQSEFFRKIMKTTEENIEKAVNLLTKYSLITKTGSTKVTFNDSFFDIILFRKKVEKDIPLFSIHRLLQQVMRHNEEKSSVETIRKILYCDGFFDHKLIPYIHANDQLRKEFPSLRTEFIHTSQLANLLKEKRFKDARDVAEFTFLELRNDISNYNYAICLEKCEETNEALQILQNLASRRIDSEKKYSVLGIGIILNPKQLNKSLLWSTILNIQQSSLHRLLSDQKFPEAVQLSELIHRELNQPSSLYNFAICLAKAGKVNESLEKLQNLFDMADSTCKYEFLIAKLMGMSVAEFEKQVVEFNKLESLPEPVIRSVLNGYESIYNDINLSFKVYKRIFNEETDLGLLELWMTPDKLFVGISRVIQLSQMGNFEEASATFKLVASTILQSHHDNYVITLLLMEILRIFANFKYSFSYFAGSREGPSIEFQGVNFKSIALKKCMIPEKFYLPDDLHELTLDSLKYYDSKGKLIPTVNVNGLIGEKSIKNICLISDDISTKLTVDLKALSSLEKISLENCTISVDANENRITSKEIRLKDITFEQEGYVLLDIPLNDIFDFPQISTFICQGCDVIIDMSENIRMETIWLDQVKIMNWREAKWKIENMVLINVPFNTENQLVVENLTITNVIDEIDIKYIPKTVNTLSFSSEQMQTGPEIPISLPDLQSLFLEDKLVYNLSSFSTCETLIDLELVSKHTIVFIDLNRIPKGVKRIGLNGRIGVTGDCSFKLETLILNLHHVRDIINLLPHLQPSKLLVIYIDDCIQEDDFLLWREIIQKPRDCHLLIGNVYWKNDDSFEMYKNCNVLNEKAEFYSARNGTCNAIERKEFEEIISY